MDASGNGAQPAGKLDYKKAYREFYAPKGGPALVDVPAFRFLMVDGEGGPDCPAFAAAIETLFQVSYKAKFAVKRETGVDFAVMPLEGLWWADDMDDFLNGNRSRWKWTLMIMQGDPVTGETIRSAIEACAFKVPEERLLALRLESFAEGPSAQVLHVGPFSAEGEKIRALHPSSKKAAARSQNAPPS